jgi:hypothetical protein
MTHPYTHLDSEESRCNRGGKCIYGFPHPITLQTYIDDEGRVHYRRRDPADLWIASHIPELIDELDCHIFVDIVYTVKVFMYLYKYLFKGPDRALFRIQDYSNHEDQQPVDEANDYVNARYLCAPEAAWRILGFDISSKEPSVKALFIHLPGEHVRHFSDDESSTSALIRYFHRPHCPEFQNLLYTDYNSQYVFYPYDEDSILDDDAFLEESIRNVTRRIVRKRRRRESISCIQTISPTSGEVFYLRCLLTHRPARSFQDIRTFGDTTFETYHEAAVHMGLFNTEDEGWYALEEAVSAYQTPAQLRFLFARIILEGYPARPLWDHFLPSLSLDHITSTHSNERGIDLTLQQISEFIEDGGHKLTDFGLPEPTFRSPEVLNELEAFEGRHQLLLQQVDDMIDEMDLEQQEFFNIIYSSITLHENDPEHHRTPQPFFIEGKPGRGKSFLADAVACKFRAEGKIVLVIGTSALAAALHERGRTAHSLFRIPVKEVHRCSLYHSAHPHLISLG